MRKIYNPFTKYLLLIVILFAAVSVVVLKCCNGSIFKSVEEKQVENGKALAHTYCSSCHQFPDPSLIDKTTWLNGVLPAMAKQFKLEDFHGRYGLTTQSTISLPDFEAITAYYKSEAPKALVIPKDKAVADWAIFSLQKPGNVSYAPGNNANTLMLAYNQIDKKLYSSDLRNNLYSWTNDLKPQLLAKMPSPVVGANFYSAGSNKNLGIFTCIGVLNPTDDLKGSIIELNLDKNKNSKQVMMADSLPRPVQTVAADFNKDGLIDYVTCGFGRNSGGLYLFTQQKDKHFKKELIRGMPGGEQLITGDFNNDGYPDVMCLFAQADEGLWMFLNDKKGGFITKNLLHFPPIYGSSSFQLVDFNHDGKPDILYTAGDNSDYSPVLKPYHGVYIFTNQGNWTFKQTYFHHIDGSMKAIAADFDHDGDMDIATISYFPDFKDHPQQGFTYLEQTKPNEFLAHEIPVNSYGRWIAMEVADMDNDGYPDVILGNFSVAGRGLINQKGIKQNWDKFMPLIVLKNNSGKLHRLNPSNSK
jgi:hypothetical protein